MYLTEGELFQDKYRVLRKLGAGGMGIVHRAVEEAIERQVAIKQLLPDLVADEHWDRWLARVEEEARFLARIRDPGVVQLFEYGKDPDGIPFMVTEYVPGGPLAYPRVDGEMPAAERWLRWREFLLQIRSLLRTLDCVHRAGVVHLDLKPGNVLVQSTYGGHEVRILDFGLAALLDDGPAAHGRVAQDLADRVGEGTVRYMAPEQCVTGEAPSRATDLFSVGVMAYRGLCGSHPFADWPERGMLARLGERASARPLPPPSWVPGPLQDVMLRALERRPVDRFGDAREMRIGLERAFAASQARRPGAGVTGGTPRAEPEEERETRPHLVTATKDPRRLGLAFARSPHRDRLLLIIPHVPGTPAAADNERATDEVIAPAMEGLTVPETGEPLQLEVIGARELLDDALLADRVERLELSRVVLWEKGYVGRRLSGLLWFHAHIGTCDVIHLAGEEVLADLRHLPAVSYSPAETAREESIRRVSDRIAHALNRSWRHPALETLWASRAEVLPRVVRATRNLARGRNDRAVLRYARALEDDPGNTIARIRLAYLEGRMARNPGDWQHVARTLQAAVDEVPSHGPAWRELGVAWRRLGRLDMAARCLRRATELEPDDHDALASLGGVLKLRAERLGDSAETCEREALGCYESAVRITGGHSYPLLNAIRIRATRDAGFRLDGETRTLLEGVVAERKSQVDHAADPPWSHFDASEALLYLGRTPEALALIQEGWEQQRRHYTRDALSTYIRSLEAVASTGMNGSGIRSMLRLVRDLRDQRG